MQSPIRRVEDLRGFVLQQEAIAGEREREMVRLQNLTVNLGREEEILRKTELVITEIAQKVLGSSSGVIDQLVTGGLRAVFTDQKLEFKTKIDRYRGKTAMKFELLHNDHQAPLMEGYGGGVIVVIGILLRVAVIMALNLRRVLLLDESLANVAEQYVPNVSALLKKLCRELGFTILLVTHSEHFAEEADTHYQARDGGPEGTIFVKMKSHKEDK